MDETETEKWGEIQRRHEQSMHFYDEQIAEAWNVLWVWQDRRNEEIETFNRARVRYLIEPKFIKEATTNG